MGTKLDEFLASASFAVAGASTNRAKYGNKVFRALLDSGREVYALNPNASVVEGKTAFPSIEELPVTPEALSVVTPPVVTREIVQQAIEAGVKRVWMQPGAEDSAASEAARAAGLEVIDDGSCILVLLAIESRKT